MNGDVLRGGCRGEATGSAAGPVVGESTGLAGSEVAEVSVAVSQWVEQLGQFLGVVQAALEQSDPRADAPAEIRAMAGQLPALIRQCRAQAPTPEMIQTWVQTLTESRDAPAAGAALAARCPA